MKSSVSGIILCGGKGTRSGSAKNKVLCYFGTKTALEYCIDALTEFCDELIVVANENDKVEINNLINGRAEIVMGGKTRFESVKNGLKAVKTDGIVLIHDAARPFVSSDTIKKCVESAKKYGSGIAAVKIIDAVKRVKGDIIIEELDRSELYRMQTPQAFRYNDIKEAYDKAEGNFNDDSAVYASMGYSPRIVLSHESNKKITVPEDMISTPPCDRIGTGVDFHRLTAGRPLILGGVNIPYDKGLLGHSDADVLTHAVMDALLSAIGEPDIGVLFPPIDLYKNADSVELLKTVVNKVNKIGSIIGVSAVVIATAPKLCGYICEMKKKLAHAMRIDEHKINISATTTEGMGIIGKDDGIAASAVCLIQNK